MSRAVLNEILDRCIAGDCDQATAAKIVGIRKASLAELVRLRRAEVLGLRRLAGAFHAAFPECDPRLARRYQAPARESDDLLRAYPVAPCKTYSAEEAATLPASQPHLIREPENEFVSYNTNEAARFIRATRRHPRAIPIRLLPDRPMTTSGPEFQFASCLLAATLGGVRSSSRPCACVPNSSGVPTRPESRAPAAS